MLTVHMRRIVQNLRRQNMPVGVIQNYLKEFLQLHVLDFIYNSSLNKAFIFTGGTCLRLCYGLNRLSEDLDFDLLEEIDLARLAQDVCDHFTKKLQHKEIERSIKGKNEKIYLKFPVLKSLGLAEVGGSDKLYVKIETSPVVIKNFGIELASIDRERLNFLVKHYDLPTLMAGKINAIFNRTYFKGKKNEITFKGRDLYDLVWYLERGVHPNMDVIRQTLGMDTEKVLYTKIREKVMSYNPEHLLKDLENLFDNQAFIRNWTENFRLVLSKHIKE